MSEQQGGVLALIADSNFVQGAFHVDVVTLSLVVDPAVTFAADDCNIRSRKRGGPIVFRRIQTDTELTDVPLLAGLSKKQLGLASRLSTALDLPAGQVLARQGSIGAEFFIVLEGHVEVIQGGDLIATRGPGSPLGEIALLTARPRTATLIAQTPLRARVASQRELAGLLVEVPAISQRLHATMAERLAAER